MMRAPCAVSSTMTSSLPSKLQTSMSNTSLPQFKRLTITFQGKEREKEKLKSDSLQNTLRKGREEKRK